MTNSQIRVCAQATSTGIQQITLVALLAKFMVCDPFPDVNGFVSLHRPKNFGSYLPVVFKQVILVAELVVAEKKNIFNIFKE